MGAAEKIGVLLVNLGSPASPGRKDVAKYLREFLMDPLVIDIPLLWRWILVNLIIAPFRSRTSAEAYRQIWTKKGSPLVYITEEFSQKLQSALGENYQVFWAMRYGAPAIPQVVEQMSQAGLHQWIHLPLYPQEAASSSGTAETAVRSACRSLAPESGLPPLTTIPAFFDQPDYLSALENHLKRHIQGRNWEHILFSYHGLPERHVRKTQTAAGFCLKENYTCCSHLDANNCHCYRAQCHYVTQEMAQRLGLKANQYTLCFQSRLGKDPWIGPNTTEVIQNLAAGGCRSLLSVSPSFVTDCLETLEEMALRNRNLFKDSGGSEFYQIPALNCEPDWIEAAANLIRQHTHT